MTDIRVYAVGIDVYDHRGNLRFCANDARLFATAMESFDQASVHEVMTAPAADPGSRVTADDVRRIIDDIAGLQAGDSDVVIFYFAGHGVEHRGGDYLLASDSETNSLGTERMNLIPTTAVMQALRLSGAGRALMIIDACRSDGVRSASDSLFGEQTRDAAAKHGIVSMYACLPKQRSHEHEELGEFGGQGVFTHVLADLLQHQRRLVPALAHDPLREEVGRLCQQFRLGPQTPEIAVTSVAVTNTDLLTGRAVALHDAVPRMILLAGPPNTGKSTIGARLAPQIGFTHIEMSTYAHIPYREARDRKEFTGTIQEFMDQVVWKDSAEYDRIARDVLDSVENDGVRQLVVSGPRRVEEIEAFRGAGFEIECVYLYSDSRTRYQRLLNRDGAEIEYAIDLEQFIRRDLLEQSWGLPNIGLMNGCAIVRNEDLEAAIGAIVRDHVPHHWHAAQR